MMPLVGQALCPSMNDGQDETVLKLRLAKRIMERHRRPCGGLTVILEKAGIQVPGLLLDLGFRRGDDVGYWDSP